MPAGVLRRVLSIPVLIVAASFGIFLLPRLAGADTTRAVIRARTAEAAPDPEVAARVARELGLDRSLLEQYLAWLGHAVRGDLGFSFATRTPVAPQLFDALGVSAVLTALALLLAAVVGIPAGVYAARRPGGWLDRSVTGLSVAGVAVPEFILAPVLVLIFAVGMGVLPATGWGDPVQAVLPVATLAAFPTALAAQLTRADMLDVLGRPHVTLARAKGLSERRVIWVHAARLACTSVTSLSGIFFAGMLSGAVVVEVIFAVPGLGRLLYDAVMAQDLPMLQSGLLLVVAIAVAASLLAESVALLGDPVARQVRAGR
ncbi:ABC transporter permease [Pseudonocardia bannensis]|uniref:ABC transporter permease n=1 Tax=Pseudonocardia bannensis TaxID=630973 RepID=A0A848DGN8_9PSEU|nr:ABC transporter permease [Pseudonocardia bannensis]NMH91704.1 ABC transporter permease [Pseudonocardia bannensis]